MTMAGGAITLVALVGVVFTLVSGAAVDIETEPSYWRGVAQDELRKTLSQRNPTGAAKNVILFLGDGMGPTSVTAGRILAGQMAGIRGEEFKLAFDKFPFTGLSVTYNVNTQVTDSAASGTAYLCGVKTNQGMLGLDAHAQRTHCETTDGREVTSILDWFMAAGRSTGIVTTTRVTHATPGASYAHTPERNWESDHHVPSAHRDCKDIAAQLIEDNPNITVIMGGGRKYFVPRTENDPDPEETTDPKGHRYNKNLIEIWKANQAKFGLNGKFVYDKNGLDQVNPVDTDRLLGLFSTTHLDYELQRDKAKQPSLADMTEKAIRILSKNSQGYFLLVEGGRIDHGHHGASATKALHDVVSLHEAVERAVSLVNKDETLMVVTADHSHTMSIAGYSNRGNPILGIANTPSRTSDHLPYTTLLYGNGAGYHSPRPDISKVNTEDDAYHQQTAVPMNTETHGGEDVAIYASGPQSFLYAGVHEQNYIPVAMAYAACVGDFSEAKQNCAKHYDYGMDQAVVG